MKQYLDLCRTIMNNGVDRPDRTGTGTRGIFGYQMRFDLSEGFPLLTTKKLNTKAIIYELLWFIRGETNIEWLNEHGVHIWDAWRQPYSLNRSLVFVDKMLRDYVPYSGTFSFAGIDASRESIEGKLANTWRKMMERCYNPHHENYRFYGAKKVSVCEYWHDAKNFIEDAQKLPHWWYKENNWNDFDLDKDYFGSNQYSPETCVWLSSDENRKYMLTSYPIEVINDNGESEIFLCFNDVVDKIGISRGSLGRWLEDGPPKIFKQGNRAFMGWKFKFYDLENKLLRMQLIPDGELGPGVYGASWRKWPTENGTMDQIANVIKSIKENPYGRRHIVTAWNPADLSEVALPPCHCFFQFYVAEGKLSCQMYQRSCDTFLGVPFNIASYSLLTMMVAQVCGLKPGTFVHTLGDVHIYKNHFNQVTEQLIREPRSLPTMRINPDVTDIDGFKFEDFELTGYDPWPAIKGEISV